MMWDDRISEYDVVNYTMWGFRPTGCAWYVMAHERVSPWPVFSVQFVVKKLALAAEEARRRHPQQGNLAKPLKSSDKSPIAPFLSPPPEPKP
jgi:hypothetical protein